MRQPSFGGLHTNALDLAQQNSTCMASTGSLAAGARVVQPRRS